MMKMMGPDLTNECGKECSKLTRDVDSEGKDCSVVVEAEVPFIGHLDAVLLRVLQA